MKLRPALLALAIVGSLGLAACKRDAATAPTAASVAPPAGETADGGGRIADLVGHRGGELA